MKNIYWLLAVVYGFVVWGFWWGMFSILIPILPLIDLAKYVAHLIR